MSNQKVMTVGAKGTNDVARPIMDLSLQGAMEFKTQQGFCKECGGEWPLLQGFSLCKMCIVLGLNRLAIGNPIITAPKGYREGKLGSCGICEKTLEKGAGVVLAQCFGCDEFFHAACYKQAGNAKCPVCGNTFTID